jgi:hypothetical protein
MPVDAVEKAIEDFYRSVQLTPEQIEKVRRDVGVQIEERLAVARMQSEHHSRRLRTLQDEQQKLVQLYYKKAVSEEVLQAEQQRIEAERTQAQHWVKAATHEAQDVMEALDETLTIVGRCHETYLDASPMLRRLMNQVIFERLLIQSDHVECEQQPVFRHITRLGRGCQTPAKARRPQNGQDPRLLGGLGSNVDQMVRPSGLEPPRTKWSTRRSRISVTGSTPTIGRWLPTRSLRGSVTSTVACAAYGSRRCQGQQDLTALRDARANPGVAHTTAPPPSAALAGWETSVDAALSQLEHAHRAVGGTHSGRRTNTLQLNYAFVLLLSAHFQAFCRDLHSEAVEHLRDAVELDIGDMLAANLTRYRQLDSRNAQPAIT